MYAVIETGGKQFRVEEGDVVSVEKLNEEIGSTIVLDKVILVSDDAGTRVGAPYLEGVSVSAEVLDQGKAKKIIVFKYKPKKGYKRKQGHRQLFTKLHIVKINA